MNYPLQSKVGLFASAYVLAGGASRRMGRDKALLNVLGEPILVHLVNLLSFSFESVAVLAPPGRYEAFGFRIVPDLRNDCGPLAAIESALRDSRTDWNLIVACDLPNMARAWLESLIAAAESAEAGQLCIASGETEREVNPLCALWHKAALPFVESALDRGNLRVRDLMTPLKAKILIPPDPKILANWNHPEDWIASAGEGNTNLDG